MNDASLHRAGGGTFNAVAAIGLMNEGQPAVGSEDDEADAFFGDEPMMHGHV